jgi:hypothetical protein
MIEAIIILGSVCLIVGGVLLVQKNYIQAEKDYIILNKELKDNYRLSNELEARLKEFDEYKKKIDSLVLKAGFKL